MTEKENTKMECGKDDCICCKKMYRTSHYVFVGIIALFMGFLIGALSLTIYDTLHSDFLPDQKMAEMCNTCMGDANITAVAHCYLGTQLSTARRIDTTIRCSLKETMKENQEEEIKPEEELPPFERWLEIIRTEVTIGDKVYMADPNLRHNKSYQELVNKVWINRSDIDMYRDNNNFTVSSCGHRGEPKSEKCERLERQFIESGKITYFETDVVCLSGKFGPPFVPICNELPLWRYVNESEWKHFPDGYFNLTRQGEEIR